MKDYTKTEELTAFSSTWTACPHNKGWYFKVKFWIFKKDLFWCDDCHKPFDAEFIKTLGKK